MEDITTLDTTMEDTTTLDTTNLVTMEDTISQAIISQATTTLVSTMRLAMEDITTTQAMETIITILAMEIIHGPTHGREAAWKLRVCAAKATQASSATDAPRIQSSSRLRSRPAR